LQKQEPLIEELNIRVDKQSNRLVTLNAQLKKTLKKVTQNDTLTEELISNVILLLMVVKLQVRPVKRCCCDCILILAILGLVVAIFFVVS
jgi:hypothetical protein